MASPFETFTATWQRRKAAYDAAGVPTSAYAPVYQYDLARVKQGSSPLSGLEAALAAKAAMGEPPVQEHPAHGLLGMIGNIPSDIANVTTGIIHSLPKIATGGLGAAGGAALGTALLPGVGTAIGGMLGGALGADVTDIGKLGELPTNVAHEGLLKGLAETPVTRMIPGVTTASELTSPEGRAKIEEHPIGTLLDVLPLAHGAGAGAAEAVKLAAPEFAAGAGEKAAQAAEAASLGKVPDHPLTAAEKAYTAAQKGRPVRALYRLMAPETTQALLDAKLTRLTRAFGIDPALERMRRGTAAMQREGTHQVEAMNKALEDVSPRVLEWDAEHEAAFFKAASEPNKFHMAPEDEAVLARMRQLNEEQARTDVEENRLFATSVGEQEVHFANEGPEAKVGKAYNTAEAARTSYQAHFDKHLVAEETIRAEEDRLRARIGEAQRSIEYHRARPGKGQRLIKAEERLRTLQGQYTNVRQRPAYQKSVQELAKRAAKLQDTSDAFHEVRNRTAPARFQPMIEAEVRARAKVKAQGMADAGELTGTELDEALKNAERSEFGKVFNDKELRDVRQEVEATWTDLVKEGYDPLWVHNISGNRLQNIFGGRAFGERYLKPSALRSKVFDVTPRYQSVGVAIHADGAERIWAGVRERTIQEHLLPTGVSRDVVEKDLQAQLEAIKARDPRADDQFEMQRLLEKNYVRYDPERWGFAAPRARGTDAGELYIPKYIHDAFVEMVAPEKVNAVTRGFRKGTSLYKMGLFAFSLKHFSHIVLGGAFAMMMRGGSEEVTQAARAWKAAKAGEFDPRMPIGVDMMTTDQILHEAVGMKARRLLGKIGNANDWLRHLEETLNNWERVTSLFAEETRALKAGSTPEMAREVALQHVQKTFIDWDGLHPLERQIARSYMPFYPFTRYVLSYLLTYPIDHPIRAAVISHLAETESADWKSGLPQQWQNLFFLGTPDQMGNVKVSDIKSINPFRDAANLFTFRGLVPVGLLSGLGPVPRTALESLGLNTLSGSEELYPQVDFDPVTGRLVTKPKPMGFKVVEELMPPTRTLDYFFGLSDQTRRLKATDPQAFRRSLLTDLNLPFIPYDVNVSKERIKEQINLFKVAQQQVASGMHGNVGAMERFNLVPYGGRLVAPSLLEQAVRAATGHGVAPKELIAKPKRKGRRPAMRP